MNSIRFALLILLIVAISCEKKEGQGTQDLNEYTNISDTNFEKVLIDYGYDDVLDGKVLTNNINTITSLELSDKQISDLSGIEDFIGLTILICDYNNLKNLDITKNTKLVKLDCWDNMLTSLDVSKNLDLQELICGKNQISAIDVSNNSSLVRLVLEKNQLLNVDVTKNLVLRELWIGDNELKDIDVSTNNDLLKLCCNYNMFTYLDVSNNPDLRLLSCTHNALISLNVSNNTSLFELYCSNNRLLNLNVKNGINKAMTYFYAKYNNLTCIEVDDPTWSSLNWSNDVDYEVSFSTNCE